MSVIERTSGTIADLNGSEYPEHIQARFAKHLTDQGATHLFAVGLCIAPQTAVIKLVEAYLETAAPSFPDVPLWPERVMQDASLHATGATPLQRKAYCFAHYEAMTRQHQAAFLAHITPSVGVPT